MTDFTLVDPKGWEYDLHSVSPYFMAHICDLKCCFAGLLCVYWLFPDTKCPLVSVILNELGVLELTYHLYYRYDRSWGHLFESFEEFLAFSWPVITVTDAISGRAHIVTRLNSIGAFIKMIKTR